MDKKIFKSVCLKKIKHYFSKGFLLFSETLSGVFFCFLGVCLTFYLAENGSNLFYYAMAFASPGSAIEFLREEESPVFPEEDFSSVEVQPEDHSVFEEQEAPVSDPEESFPEIPENRRGKVTETQYSAKEGGIYISCGNAIIKNCTDHSAEKIKAMLEKEHSLSIDLSLVRIPQVLIYHTHATEAFEPFDLGYFDISGSWRSTDSEENMIAVGNAFAAVLSEKGIGFIHDTTMHDDPSYNGSYQRSAVTVKKHLSENPGVSVCLDLHRDAIEPSSKEIIKPTVVINGRKAAQIMIISGCDNGNFNMPDYWENLRFAAALADKLEELYPGICRPILFDYRKYNMDLSPGLLLIEIGATGNTLEEAKYSAELLGNALAELLAE